MYEDVCWAFIHMLGPQLLTIRPNVVEKWCVCVCGGGWIHDTIAIGGEVIVILLLLLPLLLLLSPKHLKYWVSESPKDVFR